MAIYVLAVQDVHQTWGSQFHDHFQGDQPPPPNHRPMQLRIDLINALWVYDLVAGCIVHLRNITTRKLFGLQLPLVTLTIFLSSIY